MRQQLPSSFIWQLALFAIWYPVWMLQTVGFGFLVIWKVTRWFLTRSKPESETTTCPRNHEVPLYGVYQCACGCVHEGQVFSRCLVCGETCGWTPCPTCSLPVCNPEFQR